ncbi:hypothetical protein M902_2416 [Bacteriovorax sp. BAL6_X]|uniref:hypothetical protein n=1 Tax=Bacteriovorax sp. BAL6_X TaxID=1201290 RepID=UPI0003863DCE|nr:hypothetical protein [Bacteriovorax sp. BAL6_X]EPZ51884.1 hypothetical protein M902_2416 [Bacteriovorax sp. BAL6_X]
MKKLLSVAALFLSFNVAAVETTARPFSFDVYAPSKELNFKVTLEQRCRYEIPVWGDSAKFEEKNKTTPLTVKKSNQSSGLTRYTFSLNHTQSLEMSGFFKYGKECTSGIKIIVQSAKYAVGWANQFHRPIEFSFLNEMYAYKEYDTVFDPSENKNIKLFENNEISFAYEALPNANQVNVTILSDGNQMPTTSSKSALKNPKTNLPYNLK